MNKQKCAISFALAMCLGAILLGVLTNFTQLRVSRFSAESIWLKCEIKAPQHHNSSWHCARPNPIPSKLLAAEIMIVVGVVCLFIVFVLLLTHLGRVTDLTQKCGPFIAAISFSMLAWIMVMLTFSLIYSEFGDIDDYNKRVDALRREGNPNGTAIVNVTLGTSDKGRPLPLEGKQIMFQDLKGLYLKWGWVFFMPIGAIILCLLIVATVAFAWLCSPSAAFHPDSHSRYSKHPPQHDDGADQGKFWYMKRQNSRKNSQIKEETESDLLKEKESSVEHSVSNYSK